MNSLVTIHGDKPVTTSLALAEGTGNQHKNVMELIRRYRADLEDFGGVAFKTLPFETPGGTQSREVAILNEPQSTLLLTFLRNSPIIVEFKKRLVKEFYEMAERLRAPQIKVPTNLLEALQLATELEGKRMALEQKVERDAPKVEFAEAVEQAPGEMSVAEAAKVIGTGQKRLFAFLRRIGWINADRYPYQRYIELGYVRVVPKKREGHNGGLVHYFNTVITGKGLLKLRQLLSAGSTPAVADMFGYPGNNNHHNRP